MSADFPSVSQTSDGWEVSFAVEVVIQTTFDYAVSIVTDNLNLRIEEPFKLVSPATDDVSLEPGKSSGMESIIALHGSPLTGLTISESGRLTANFDERRIEVNPGDHFEAYVVNIKPGWMFVATPGGGTTVWRPSRE